MMDEGSSSTTASPPPTTSTTNGDECYYQLKWIPWNESFIPIVTQNENGPCPLIALSNVLLLSRRMKIAPGETFISSTDLMDLLGSCLLESPRPHHSDAANYHQNMQDAIAVFPKLQTGLDVNVKFDSVGAFEFTSESGIFDLFDVPLFHGWLVDPQDVPTFSVISKLSYNQLVEMIISNSTSTDPEKHGHALLGEQFLANTSSQLTHHGLCELNRIVKEGDMCVFFRNNHFNTLFKRKDQLLLLVTDSGFVNELGHVWQVVSDIDGSGDFLDGQFQLSTYSMSQQNREQHPSECIDILADTDTTPQTIQEPTTQLDAMDIPETTNHHSSDAQSHPVQSTQSKTQDCQIVPQFNYIL